MMGARDLEKMTSWLLYIIVSLCVALQGSPVSLVQSILPVGGPAMLV